MQEGEWRGFSRNRWKPFLDHPFRLKTRIPDRRQGRIALFPDDGADADTLFKNAEAALKKAKASGDRYLFYTQKMTETVPAGSPWKIG
jgi:GGDEF domain-containing protein